MEKQVAAEKAKVEKIAVATQQTKTIASSESLPQLNTKTRVKTQQQATRKVDKKASLTESIKSQKEKSLPKVASASESEFKQTENQQSNATLDNSVSAIPEQNSDGEDLMQFVK